MNNRTSIRRNFINNQLNLILMFGVINLMTLGCKTANKTISSKKSNSTVHFEIIGADRIESLTFVKIGGFSDEDIKPFTENMAISLSGQVNDLYELLIKKGDKYLHKNYPINIPFILPFLPFIT